MSRTACLALLALGAGVRLALALGTDTYFDEAYYWQWARHLAWGYYDHPPLIAWMIAAVGIRPAALLCGAGTVAAIWGLARDVHGSREAAWRAAALWSVVPVATMAGVWATPDSPLLLFWTLALWALWRERWVLAGLASGLALLSKYPAVLIAVAFLATAVRMRRLPAGVWVTALLGVLLFLPVVLWNMHREWVGFAFQLRHGLGGTGGLESFAEFLAGQLALGGPMLLPLGLVYALRGPREQFLLRAATVVPLLFFGYAALRTRGEANWPAAAYVAACVGVAGMRPVWFRAAAFSGLAVVLSVSSHLLFPMLRFERDVPLARTQGWTVLSALAEPARLFPGTETKKVAAVYAPSYQLASMAARYAGVLTDTAGGGRKSQYDLWPEPVVAPGHDALWYSEGPEPPEDLISRFTTVEGPVELPADFRGRRVHTFLVWRLRGATPIGRDVGPAMPIEVMPSDGNVLDAAGTRDFSNKYLSTVIVSLQPPLEGADCSGVMIGPQQVLTAAHCVCKPEPSSADGGKPAVIDSTHCPEQAYATTVRYGTIRSKVLADSELRVYKGSVRPHPEFKMALDESGAVVSVRADLAMIVLNIPLEQEFPPLAIVDTELQGQETLVMAGYGHGEEWGGGYHRYFRSNTVEGAEGSSKDRFRYKQQGSYIYNGFDGGPCFREEGTRRVLAGIASIGSDEVLTLTSTFAHHEWIEAEFQRAAQ